MNALHLLFTQDGLQYHITNGRTVLEEFHFENTEETSQEIIYEKLEEVLARTDINSIAVISAINHFTLMPADFTNHEMGIDLIAFNSPIDKENEELMLSINRKYGVQFYYALPKKLYNKIKAKNLPTNFNFSGEKFLNNINVGKITKEIHINLYHNQCEFFAIDTKKVVLYNNLDVNSEVDFLYFIMFTLSKIGFGIHDTHFFVYGETTENETFISELQKFVKNLKINFDNLPKKNFILAY